MTPDTPVRRASTATLIRALNELFMFPPSEARTRKLEAILRRAKPQEPLDRQLGVEVDALLRTHPNKRVLSFLVCLLGGGANVNANAAPALCQAVAAADLQVLDILLAAPPQ